MGLMYTLRFMPLNSKMFPMALLVILLAISMVSLFVMRKKFASVDLSKYKASYIIYALFIVYLLVMPLIGYMAATSLFLIASMLYLKPKGSKITAVVVSLVFAGALTLGFSVLLQVPLP